MKFRNGSFKAHLVESARVNLDVRGQAGGKPEYTAVIDVALRNTDQARSPVHITNSIFIDHI